MRSNIKGINDFKAHLVPKKNVAESEISPIENEKRRGWGDAFKEMAENGDDALMLPDVFESEDIADWT